VKDKRASLSHQKAIHALQAETLNTVHGVEGARPATLAGVAPKAAVRSDAFAKFAHCVPS
jgi:hypothetical protein